MPIDAYRHIIARCAVHNPRQLVHRHIIQSNIETQCLKSEFLIETADMEKPLKRVSHVNDILYTTEQVMSQGS